MPEFDVFVREVHVQTVRIKARTPEEAIRKVADGQGRYVDNACEYSYTLDPYASPNAWTVEEAT